MSNDKYIKSILKNFKKLEIGLNKFNSKHDAYSTNLLRTILLPFLRIDYLRKESINTKTYKGLVNIFLSLLLKWWSSLLNYLINNNLSSIDRSVYLECISRIVARKEWFEGDDKSKESDTNDRNYDELLTLTLDYSMNKLITIKHLPLSISAFIGKIFAYSFFRIPDISHALLFLLNIKQMVFEENNKSFNHLKVSEAELQLLYKTFPSHLHYIINFKGLTNLKLKNQKSFFNCLVPPKNDVKGIKNPNGSWVTRWFNSDSDIFNSFLNHYLEISSIYLPNLSELSPSLLINLPGLNIILSHVYQIMKLSINKISANNSKIKFQFNNKGNEFTEKSNRIYYNSIFKIFRTIRDFNHFNKNRSLVDFIETMLINFGKKVSIYDFNKNSLILNIIFEFLNHFEHINWNFWLNSIYLMMENSNHIEILLKNLSFIFNTWNYLPDFYSQSFQKDIGTNFLSDSEMKDSFVNWLISPKMFMKLFLHYNSIVRNYYIRLLIWRVVGINNFESSVSIKNSLKVENHLNQCFKHLQQFCQTHSDIDFKPDNPMINKKFTIVPILKADVIFEFNDEENLTLSNSSEIKKTHPYEIFDETIYSCNNSLTEVNEDKRSNSLVSSIGKIFKLLTTDDKEEDLKPPKSSSLTSLSNLSLTSRSSSPSLLSFNSTPTSLTDLSDNSSVSLKNDEKLYTFKLSPEIIRPIYKVDLINDQEAIMEKIYLMNTRRFPSKVEYLPQRPRIPTVSIFINSDLYNKFFISTENILINDPKNEPYITDNFETLHFPNKIIDMMNLGKSIFEWNLMVEEFETFLINKIENDNTMNTLDENDYFKKLIPLLSIDNSKSLNAA